MIRYVLFPILALCAAACTPQAQTASSAPVIPRDTGNMAYPAPVPAGNISTVRTR